MTSAELDSEEMRGFDDATQWLLDPRPDGDIAQGAYHRPPRGLEGCVPCQGAVVARNRCPACRYELGFTDGACK